MLNAIKLYDGRSKIIRLFENKDIKPSDFPHNAKFKPEKYDKVEEFEREKYDTVEESKQKFEESMGKRVKLKRQNKSDEKNPVTELNKQFVQKDKIINKELFKQYFNFRL